MDSSALTPVMRSNFKHLYGDIFWYGVLSGSAIAFLSVYAARLGASSFEVSLITAVPALVNLFFSMPAARWLENKSLGPVNTWTVTLHRFGYLALIPLPWLFSDAAEVWAIILITLLMSIPVTVFAIGFNAMLADVIPPDYRAEVIGKRNALMAFSLTGSTLLCGWLLDTILFPINYQFVFGVGFVGSLISTYHISQVRTAGIQPSPRVNRPLGDMARAGLMRASAGLRFLLRSRGQPLIQLELLQGRFGLFLLAYLLFYTFQYFSIPLFPLALVNRLQLTDGAISIGSALFYVVMLIVSLRLTHLSARFGHHKILAFSALIFGIYPLLLGIAKDASMYWIASLVGGAVWALAGAALLNRLMEVVPDQNRPAYMALHNVVLNLGILLGSLSGPVISEWIGLEQTLLLGAGLRILAGLLLIVWG